MNGSSFGTSFGHLFQPQAKVVSEGLLSAEQKGLKMITGQGRDRGKNGRNLMGGWEEQEEYLMQN